MHQFSKHFTIKEARLILPQVKFQIKELIRLKKSLDNIGFDIFTRRFRPGFNPDTLNEFPEEFVQMTEILDIFQVSGIIVKSIEFGLIDFPAVRSNGEEVFLCWKDGEKDLSFWHSLTGGYKGRRPLEDF